MAGAFAGGQLRQEMTHQYAGGPGNGSRPGRPADVHDSWAEDDEGEMDFNRPIVIAGPSLSEANAVKQAANASQPAVQKPSPSDLLDEAKLLARKKQQQLEQQLLEQQRRAEHEAQEKAAEEDRLRESRIREEQETARRYQDSERRFKEDDRRYREDDRRRWDDDRIVADDRRRHNDVQRLDERRQYDETDRRKDAGRADEVRTREREESAWRTENASRLGKERDFETVKKQAALMRESMQASVQRRKEEEQRAEAERVARLESRLRELDKKKEEKETAEKTRQEYERLEAEERIKMRQRELILQQQHQQNLQQYHSASRAPGLGLGQHSESSSSGRGVWHAASGATTTTANPLHGLLRDRAGAPRKIYDPKSGIIMPENHVIKKAAVAEKGDSSTRYVCVYLSVHLLV
jgi:hypothetical protein